MFLSEKLHLFIFITCLNMPIIQGVCEFPASPMKHPNGTLAYCNPDPQKFDGDSYYMRYTLNCPERTSCEYIWAGLYVCCIPPDKHIGRKPGMIPLIRKLNDPQPPPAVPVTISTLSTDHTTTTDPQSFTGTVSSSTISLTSSAQSNVAPITTDPFNGQGRTDIFQSSVVPSNPAVTSTSPPRPQFIASTRIGNFVDVTQTRPIINSVVENGDNRLQELHEQSNRSPMLAVPSGYTGVVQWPTTFDPIRFQNQISPETTASTTEPFTRGPPVSSTKSNKEKLIEKLTEMKMMKNKPIDADKLKDKRRSLTNATIDDQISNTGGHVTNQQEIQQKEISGKFFHSSYKIVTIKCLLLINGGQKGAQSFNSRLNDPSLEGEGNMAMTLRDAMNHDIPLCPEGVQDNSA